MNSKPWWASKTIWVNLVALVGAVGAGFGLELPGDLQASIVVAIMAIANIVLRFVTRQPVSTS